MKLTKEEKSVMINGLSTGISTMAFIGLPIGVYMWIISMLERSVSYITQSIAIMVICGIAIIGSLAASIVAKVKDKTGRWPTANIVYISIMLVISGLLTYFFIWLMTTYAFD